MVRASFSCRIFVLLFTLSLPARGADDSIEGYWEGAMVRDGSVRIIRVNFEKDAEGLKARIEMPDLLTYGLRPQATVFEAPSVRFRVPFYGEAALALDSPASEMIGQVGNTTPPVSIHLRRAIRPVEAPVRREEVRFQNREVTLGGTLIAPSSAGPHPCIVWISGRGGTLREDSARHKLFAQLGVASLIYDKRESGKSTGDLAKATIYDLAADAQAAVEYLAARKDINPKQIGLHGESAGGWVAPLVATRSKVPVAFIITSAGPAESVRDQQVHAYQYRLLFSETGYLREEVEAAVDYARLRMDTIFSDRGQQEFQAAASKIKST